MKQKISPLVLVIFIFVLLNVVSQALYFRLDLTENKLHTLSESTKKLLDSLKEPLTIKLYLTEKLPGNMTLRKNRLKDLLLDYSDYSRGLLAYEFLDPSADKEIENEALQNGITPVMLNIRDKNSVQQQKIFQGIVLEYANQKETMPIINLDGMLEYDISAAIKKLSVSNKPKIAILETDGSISQTNFKDMQRELDLLYEVSWLNISKGNSNNHLENLDFSVYSSLLILSPKDSLSPIIYDKLDKHIKNGGKIFFALDILGIDQEIYRGTKTNIDLLSFLSKYDINSSQEYVMDYKSNNVAFEVTRKNVRYMGHIKFPYFPIINNFGDNPITKGFDKCVLMFPTELLAPSDTAIVFEPLMITSSLSRKEKDIYNIEMQRKWFKDDFESSSLVVAAAYTFPKYNNAKIVLVTDGDMFISENKTAISNHKSFLTNSLDWLNDDMGLISLRSRSNITRPIKELENLTKEIIKYLNFFFPILIIIMYGFYVNQRNNRICSRLKKTSVTYEK